MERKEKENMNTRRDFLKVGLYGTLAGATVASGLSLLNPKEAKAAVTHPFGYPQDGLVVENTRQLAYDGYKGMYIDGTRHGGCAFGTFHAIISQLADVVGAPYDAIPTQMMDWAGGGVAGFATLCGALNGSSAAIGLICSNADAKKFISDLLSWHSETLLPTNLIGDFTIGDLPQSIAGSNLCHTSVTNWCLASGYASASSERSERCARMAGDIAAQAVDMLNNGYLDLEVPGDKTTCRQCHHMGTDFDAGQFTRGKMDCESCHVNIDPVQPSHPGGRKKKR
jgi:hypothetical protein